MGGHFPVCRAAKRVFSPVVFYPATNGENYCIVLHRGRGKLYVESDLLKDLMKSLGPPGTALAPEAVYTVIAQLCPALRY